VVVLKRRVAGLTETSLMRFVARAKQAVGLKGPVDVLVTSNAEVRSLNRRFREQDKPTDVLSFPGEPEAARDFAGDIAISAEIASQNARLLGHPVATEVKILALHGILHLRGFDHERDQGEMARLEQRLRRKLRLPIGLIERTESDRRKAAGNVTGTRRHS
jgi:probable rRNA maturation factor